MARYKVTFDLPLRLAAGERAMAIAGRLHDRLQTTRSRRVTSPEVATYRIRRGRLRAATVAMTVQAPNAAEAAVIAMEVLREALGADARSWDVAGTGATVVPVLSVVPPPARSSPWRTELPIAVRFVQDRRGHRMPGFWHEHRPRSGEGVHGLARKNP